MPWTSKGLRKRLESDIRRDYPWLFKEFNAVVLPAKPYRQVLDYVIVTVAVSDLLLKFVRGHDEFHLRLGPAHAPDDSYDFGEAIELASVFGAESRSAKTYTMSDFERLLRANIEWLKILFSQREYVRTCRRAYAQRLSRSQGY